MRHAALLLLWLSGCGGTADAVRVEEPEEAEEEEEGPAVTVALRLEEAPPDEAGTPFTRVVLVAISPDEGRRTAEVGTFEGACFAQPAGDGALLRARCWWGGVGAEIHVTRDGDAVVAWLARTTDGAPAEPPTEAARVPLPEDATLSPL